jgi:hypothetical protein
MASVFVQIPSYHDYELGRTIRDAMYKSSGNNDINFGVHLSYYKDNDINVPNLNNVRIEVSEAPNNLGQGTSRHIANELYDGEDYYLQIDSHTRFEEGWDESLIENYNFYKDIGLNPVISCYPGAYEYNYIPHQRAVANPNNNIFTRSVSGGSIFSDGGIASIKPNKDMYFWAEEILTAIRLYTHGYDLLLPKKQNIYHLYYDEAKGKNNQRRQVGQDFPNLIRDIDIKSKYELARIIENKVVGEYALGSARSLEEYQVFAGIDFALKKVYPVV